MTPEWFAAVIALVAAFVAGGAAIVAYSQAISAKRQADSSETSARAALDQADAAKTSAKSAEVQAQEAKRTNDLAARVAAGDALSALDAYTAALGAMSQAVAAQQYGHAIPSNDRRRLIGSAQQRRSEVMSQLATRELMTRWMGFEAEFDTLSLYLAGREEGGPTSDVSLIRLSTRAPGQTSQVDALKVLASLWFTLLDLRKHIEDRLHAALP